MIEVDPASGADLRRLAAALRRAGNPLRADVLNGMADSANRLGPLINRAAVVQLPARGGFGRYVAGANWRARKSGGQNPTVTLRGTLTKNGGQVDLGAINRGRSRHPTFGHRPWVIQTVRPGYVTKTVERYKPVIQQRFIRSIEKAMHDIASEGS